MTHKEMLKKFKEAHTKSANYPPFLDNTIPVVVLPYKHFKQLRDNSLASQQFFWLPDGLKESPLQYIKWEECYITYEEDK